MRAIGRFILAIFALVGRLACSRPMRAVVRFAEGHSFDFSVAVAVLLMMPAIVAEGNAAVWIWLGGFTVLRFLVACVALARKDAKDGPE